MGDDGLIGEQIDYYRARAAEYDARLRELDRYVSLGGAVISPTPDGAGEQELVTALHELDSELPVRNALELACGTGWWTQRLARGAHHVTALDSSPEMLALNRERVAMQNVRYVLADVLSWRPDRQYDLVFFSFWLSHVPDGSFSAFWDLVRSAITTKGRFFLIDELDTARIRALETRLSEGVVVRTLEDGRTFRAVKVYHRPALLRRKLRRLGWEAEVEACGRDFFFARGSRG